MKLQIKRFHINIMKCFLLIWKVPSEVISIRDIKRRFIYWIDDREDGLLTLILYDYRHFWFLRSQN